MTSPSATSVGTSPLLASTAPVADPATATARDKLSGVAKQFEAIFLRQMLASARNANFGESLFSGSQAMGTFRQMQDENFADIAADTGAFGLAKMIETHLARLVPAEAVDATAKDTAAKQETTGNGI